MAIVVLVFWVLTAGAGFYMLVTSSLGRARPTQLAEPTESASATPGAPVAARSATQAASAIQAAAATPAPANGSAPLSSREQRRAARERWDPPSLTASKKAPMVPGVRSVLEFAHPVCAIIGLGFWLGFTLVHNRLLGWIAFGLVAVTASAGLTWLTANVRAAKRGDPAAPNFVGRLMVLHGCAAALTVALAALTALGARG